MKRFFSGNTFFVLCLLVVSGFFVTACSSTSSTGFTSTTSSDSSSVTTVSSEIIIDVRSPEEFSQGTLPGAVNINVESPDFVDRISSLDKSESYTVFCRSGRRSAIAAGIMKDNGFTLVKDLGSLESAASALDLPVVSP